MTPDTIDFNSLSKKQLVELVIAKYNDCFRLEEENKKLNGRIANLKEEVEDSHKIIEHYKEEKNLMEKQIKKLKAELSKYKKPHPRFSDFGGYDE